MEKKLRKTSSLAKKTEVAPQSPVEKKIRKILKGDRERHDSLGYLYGTLNQSDQVQFREILQNLATGGTPDEQVVAIETIRLLKAQDMAEDVFEYHLGHTDIERSASEPDNYVIWALVGLVHEFELTGRSEFCEKVLDYSLRTGDTFLYSASLRTLTTLDWRRALGEIKRVIRGSAPDNSRPFIADTLAYFKVRHKPKDWKELLSLLSKEERQIVSSFKSEVQDRYDMYRHLFHG